MGEASHKLMERMRTMMRIALPDFELKLRIDIDPPFV